MASVFKPGQAQPSQSPYASASPYGQQRPPAFQASTQNFDGTTSQMPNFQQRDAFISQINSQLGTAQQQSWQRPGMGAPHLDFQKMWGQAGQMVKDGWQNPLTRSAPAMGQARSASPSPQGAPYNPASGYRPPTPQNIREDQRQRQQANREATATAREFSQSPEFAAQQRATAERERANIASSEAKRQQYRDNLDSQFLRPEGMSDEAFYYLAANSASGDRVWKAPSKGVYQELVGNQRFANMAPGPERDLREQQAYGSFIRHAAPAGPRQLWDRARQSSQAESLGDLQRFSDWRPFEGMLQRRA